MHINNKGQSLVLFVIFLPIFIILSGFLIDIGIAENNKNKLNNINYSAISYGLDNYNEKMITDLIYENDKNIKDIIITKDKEQIKIVLKKEVNSIYGFALKILNYKIESVYIGEYINNKKVINKVRTKKI